MIAAGFTPWRQFHTSLFRFCSRQSIIMTAVIAFLTAPAFALMIYGAYSLLGSGSMSERGSDGAGDEGTMAVTASSTPSAIRETDSVDVDREANSSNRGTKGDRIILSAAEAVRQRFVFETAPPEAVPLPRPRPEDLIALDAPPVDLQPALGQDKRAECEWDKLHTLPDFMRSCLAPPLQLTPPKQ